MLQCVKDIGHYSVLPDPTFDASNTTNIATILSGKATYSQIVNTDLLESNFNMNCSSADAAWRGDVKWSTTFGSDLGMVLLTMDIVAMDGGRIISDVHKIAMDAGNGLPITDDTNHLAHDAWSYYDDIEIATICFNTLVSQHSLHVTIPWTAEDKGQPPPAPATRSATTPTLTYSATHYAFPRVAYFRLPVAMAGTPQFYGGERVLCDPVNDNCAMTDYSGYGICAGDSPPVVYCQDYQYGIQANIHLTVHGKANGRYDVSIYNTVAQAQSSMGLWDKGGVRDDAGNRVPRQPIAYPINGTERMTGEVLNTHGPDCLIAGGIRYRTIVISVYSTDTGSVTAPGDAPCGQDYRWLTRVLRMLYSLAVALK